MSRRTVKKAFTLMELLVVIAIIVLLAGMLMSAVIKARDQGCKGSTQLLLKNIGIGCESYYTDWGAYPFDALEEDNGNSNFLCDQLLWDGITSGGSKGPYLELDDFLRMESASQYYIVDYWGEGIIYDNNWAEGTGYQSSGGTPGSDSNNPFDSTYTDHSKTFDIVSKGSDGAWDSSSTSGSDNEDNVNSWMD